MTMKSWNGTNMTLSSRRQNRRRQRVELGENALILRERTLSKAASTQDPGGPEQTPTGLKQADVRQTFQRTSRPWLSSMSEAHGENRTWVYATTIRHFLYESAAQ